MTLDPDNLFIEEHLPESLFDQVRPLIEAKDNHTIYNIKSLFNFQSYGVVGIQVFNSLQDKLNNKNKPVDFLLNLPY